MIWVTFIPSESYPDIIICNQLKKYKLQLKIWVLGLNKLEQLL